MGNFNWTNMRIAFAFAFLFIACFVGSEFVNAIPNQELGHDADASCQKHRPPNLRRGCTTQRSCTRSAGRVPFAKELFAITRDAFVDEGASINTAPIGQTTRGTLPAGRGKDSAFKGSSNGMIVNAGLSFKVD